MPHRVALSILGLSALVLPHLAMAQAEPFRDVRLGHPNAEAIAYMKEHDIVEGSADDTFRPAHQSFVFGDRISKALVDATRRTHGLVLPPFIGQSAHYRIYLTPGRRTESPAP